MKQTKTHLAKGLQTVLLLVCGAGFLLCALVFGWRLQGYRRAADAYEGLRAAAAEDPADRPRELDFAALWEKCPQAAAWLYSEDTPIDYPVLQTDDHTTYLHRLPDGTANRAGSLFFDRRCREGDPHLILYGHNMRDGSMLGTLDLYADPAYLQAHPTLYLLTPTQAWRVEVFSVYEAAADDLGYTMGLTAPADRLRFREALQEKSLYPIAADVPAEARVLTLSTCSYGFHNARFLVHGVMVPIDGKQKNEGE